MIPDPDNDISNKDHIAGVGVDIVSIDRIRRSLQKYGPSFVDRVFTEPEQTYCGDKAQPAQHYAARFAAKEAAMKVLGTGWDNGVRWTNISVHRSPEAPPELFASGKAKEIAQRLNINRFHLSLSHGADQALAFCIGEKRTV